MMESEARFGTPGMTDRAIGADVLIALIDGVVPARQQKKSPFQASRMCTSVTSSVAQ